MPKNNPVLICLIIVFVSIFFESQLCAQEKAIPLIKENVNNNVIQAGINITKNDFGNLISAKDIAYQLQKTYGVQGSVVLTKALVKILSSYSNQLQAQNIWQTAIIKISQKQKSSLPMLNVRYNIGQILKIYTHGMDAKSWNTNRKAFKIIDNDLNTVLGAHDDLTLYLNLNKIWEILLIDLAKQENIQWQEVFVDSLDLFSSIGLKEKKLNTPPKNLTQGSKDKIINLLLKWELSTDEKKLADIVLLFDGMKQDDLYFYQSVINLILEKQAQHYMSAALAWFAVAEQLHLNKTKFSETELKSIKSLVEENDAWFLASEHQLSLVNINLPQWIETSFHELKGYYENPKISGDFSLSLKSAYQMQGSQFKKYMATPFRQKIRKQLEVCLNISEESTPLPQLPIDLNQFNGCINDMVFAATDEAGSRELAGSMTKVSSNQAIKRALESPPWQVINILYASIAQQECLDQSNQYVNPLEWSMAAESLLWFADRWPAYSHQYLNFDVVKKVIKEGQSLTAGFPCLEDTKHNILETKFNQIQQSWQAVKTQVANVVNEFNQMNLNAGSDINLLSSFDLPSNYRIDEFKIGACDVQNSCGVHVDLESSRSLFGLFPNYLLVADQLKLGKLNLCYDNVGWENRRSTATHLDNDNVANYYGNFSFSLKGFYDENLVFDRQLIDSQEHLYLFGENSEVVLNTDCPLNIVGSKISTQLKRGTFGLVPNRLTFLTASRTSETDVLLSNWSKGEEWKDKILTNKAFIVENNDLLENKENIQSAFQIKAKELQEVIYHALLNSLTNPSEAQKQLSNSFAKMQLDSQFFYALSYILRMDDVMIDDKLHGIFFGENKLPDYNTIAEYYQNQVNITSLLSGIDENLNLNKLSWNSLEPKLSYSHIRNIVYQLKLLNPKYYE